MTNAVQPRALYLGNKASLRNPALPILIYKNFLERETALKSRIFERTFTSHDWVGVWKNGIFDYHHFHSNAHEVLGIARGNVQIQLGGGHGEVLELEAGDVVILPAGTGHKKLSGSDNLAVVGAYPAGQQDYDICHDMDKGAAQRVASVPMPLTDPLYGQGGPLLKFWDFDGRNEKVARR